MNYRAKGGRRKRSPLVVKEIIPPCHDKPGNGSRQNVQKLNPDLFHDMKAEPGGFCQSTLIIGNHEVKSVRSLNILEKKPLENYFGGTKEKKSTKRGTKPHKIKQSLSDLGKDIPNAELKCDQSDLNGPETPEMCLQASTQIITSTKEEITNKQLEYEIYKYMKMREYNDRKFHMQQKLEEENYIKEQEKLAETWVKYIKRKNRPKAGDDFSQAESEKESERRRKRTRTYKSRYFFRSQKFSNDDQDELSPGKVEADKKTSEERESAQNRPDFDELGQTLEKLVIAAGWDSQQRN